MTDLRGVSPILTTPYTEDGRLDIEGVAAVLQKHIQEGCHSITLFGLASEFYKLTDEEQFEILDEALRVCEGTSLDVVVSITHHATVVAEERARRAQAAGADYLMVLPPYFLDPPSAAVFRHIERVAAAVDLPVIVQYAPGPTHTTLQPSFFARVAESVDNVNTFKIEATPPGAYISELLETTESSVNVFVGNAGLGMLDAFDRGAIGVMPGSPVSDIYLDIVDAYDRGDDLEAITLFNRLLPMLNLITQSPEMAFYYGKRILKRRGVIATASTRQPAFTPDDEYDARFESCYNELSELFHD